MQECRGCKHYDTVFDRCKKWRRPKECKVKAVFITELVKEG